MFTFLDALVIVFMALAAAGLLSLCLMFLVKNRKLQKVSLYVAVALGLYLCTVSVRIGFPLFPVQAALGVALGGVSVAALVLERLSKDDEKKFRLARILAAVGLVVGLVNAFS